MKRFIAILTLIGTFWITSAYAGGPQVIERGIGGGNGDETLAVSTSAWTAGWSTAYAGQTAIYVTNKSTNTANMYMTMAASAPTTPVYVGVIVLKPGLTQFHNVGGGMICYFRSLHTSAEYVDFLRVKQ